MNNQLAVTQQQGAQLVSSDRPPEPDAEEAAALRVAEAEEHGKKLQHIMDTVPTIIRNIQGSSAGAGSGEFHKYLQARRREVARQEQLDGEQKAAEAQKERERILQEREAEEEARTAKRRAKRQKKKEKVRAKRQKTKADGNSDSAADHAQDARDLSDQKDGSQQ